MPLARRMRPGKRLWCPSADVYQTHDGWVVKVELAGVSSDEIEIKIEGTTLTIAGCRRDTFYAESLSYHQLEITYSRYEKTLSFPCPIEGSQIERHYRDGLLILHLRRGEDCQ